MVTQISLDYLSAYIMLIACIINITVKMSLAEQDPPKKQILLFLC